MPVSTVSDVTVITPAIPKRFRHGRLTAAIQSVLDQELRPHAHLIQIDYERAGTVASLNRLLAGVETPFLAVLPDDDEFYPDHLRKLREAIGGHAVAYSFCDCGGEIPHTQPEPDGALGDATIAATCMLLTEAVRDVGGWDYDGCDGNSCEDLRMWRKLAAAGGTFTCVPEVTWKYNFHGANQSREGLKDIL